MVYILDPCVLDQVYIILYTTVRRIISIQTTYSVYIIQFLTMLSIIISMNYIQSIKYTLVYCKKALFKYKNLSSIIYITEYARPNKNSLSYT